MALANALPVTRSSTRLLAFALVAAAVALVVGNRLYRTAEMALASGILRVITSGGVQLVAERQTVYFGLGGAHPFGLRMSPECTSAFLVLPLLLVAAVMIALRGRIAGRVLVALGLASVAVIAVNQLRVLTLVGLINGLGTDQGYYWGHTFLGSIVSVVGGAAALVLFVWKATR
ncbi:exosortase P [Actinokineospora globicatena]|uniref:exosortase P n=1 Tax=Actinokineospora globicatena TaxID=103729 RepID=UPI0020A3643F|nr:exosortase P [Actinokineospora globicatena]MCP2305120.1 exosortase/archaeosortase family protein [Actinokineospora globicatena]GLW80587.1 exosortase/archaeosortase family protein [Actinokineospora globicatena]GLW87415.1 exosortase/archaeosortase family protein [Actinokineospora globicatena]